MLANRTPANARTAKFSSTTNRLPTITSYMLRSRFARAEEVSAWVTRPGRVRSFSGMSSCPVETDGSAVGEPPGGATGVVGVVPNEAVGAAGTAVRVAGAAVRVAGGPAGDSGAAGAAGPAGGSVAPTGTSEGTVP